MQSKVDLSARRILTTVDALSVDVGADDIRVVALIARERQQVSGADVGTQALDEEFRCDRQRNGIAQLQVLQAEVGAALQEAVAILDVLF